MTVMVFLWTFCLLQSTKWNFNSASGRLFLS